MNSNPPDESAAEGAAEAQAAPADAAARVQEVLGSVHTTNFPDLLRQLGGCLVVSTYQAGKLVILRPDGASINTHFRSFNRPMGMAADGERIALGAYMEIAEFRNMPAVAKRLQDPPRHDAVFLARRAHVTGAIDIHDGNLYIGVGDTGANATPPQNKFGTCLNIANGKVLRVSLAEATLGQPAAGNPLENEAMVTGCTSTGRDLGMQALVEVLAGERPPRQLVAWMSTDVYGQLTNRLMVRSRSSRRPTTQHRARVVSVHVAMVDEENAEIAARFVQRGRSRAIAVRLELRHNHRQVAQWLCTAVAWG
jgi:hypothetical protein